MQMVYSAKHNKSKVLDVTKCLLEAKSAAQIQTAAMNTSVDGNGVARNDGEEYTKPQALACINKFGLSGTGLSKHSVCNCKCHSTTSQPCNYERTLFPAIDKLELITNMHAEAGQRVTLNRGGMRPPHSI